VTPEQQLAELRQRLETAIARRDNADAEIARIRELIAQEQSGRTAENVGVCPQCGAGLREDHKSTCDYRRR